ncbi:DsrE/DsrF/DrsH-like family protein [Pedomonas mirosovicensis]|uniref:DsrE/DsrF/DrsH-like family protein n=1 Tax=Pedomonas mirosovicensis TaxID=2908641 RepID=UPI0021674969|nr:DsrE/DsrF/DrsH-like family protein [Pedomonas mirosovicensis]MCH8683913.1 DsrE/DsrF/DrsH-like family protein [Pedomonas mirosovicensis]
MGKTRQGLAIIFSDSNHGRIHAGLSLACASAAMGRPVRIFFTASRSRRLTLTENGKAMTPSPAQAFPRSAKC